jgi:putative transposase
VARRAVGARSPLRSSGSRSAHTGSFEQIVARSRALRRVLENCGAVPTRPPKGTEAKLHDGTIITDKVNEMWGTDMTQTITIREGRANVFVAVAPNFGDGRT